MSLNQIPDFMLSDEVGSVKDQVSKIAGVGGVVEKTNKSEFDLYKVETTTEIGDKTLLPDWLQDSIRDVTKIHDDYLRQFAINICQPPYNANVNNLDNSSIINLALATGKNIYAPLGVYVCLSEIQMVTVGQCLFGAGKGGGISETHNPLVSYSDSTTLLFKDYTDASKNKYVKTRINHRVSAVDAQDDPLSTCINIQAENVTIHNLCVRLHIDDIPINPLEDSPIHYGANWDVGIFNGCRANMILRDVAVIGYFREACIWYDVTQHDFLPRFLNPLTGSSFAIGTVESGADGCQLHNPTTFGGKWGVKIQGAKLAIGETDQSIPYYDEILGYTVTDLRGASGFSDFLIIGGRIHGQNHHTLRRLYDFSNNINLDYDKGGAYSIDGYCNNSAKAIHGHRYINTRFSTWEPICVFLGRTSRDLFIGCHYDGGVTSYSVDGLTTISASDPNYCYGGWVNNDYTLNTKIIACSSNPYTAYWKYHQGDYFFANDFVSQQIFGCTSTQFGTGYNSTDDSNVVIMCGDTGNSRLYLGSKSKVDGFVMQYTASSNTLVFRRLQPNGTVDNVLNISRFDSGNVQMTVPNQWIQQASNIKWVNNNGVEIGQVTNGGNLHGATGITVDSSGGGVILKSPNGTSYTLTVTDVGALTVTPS